MAKKPSKDEKAVEKIRKAVRKAIAKGVSATVVSTAVADALATDTDNEAGGPENTIPEMATARMIPSLDRNSKIVLKRGIGKHDMNTKPIKPDSEKPSLKKLPGKPKPPTLTLK